MRRSLFIGLGGSGYIALSKIKKNLQRLLGESLPPSLQFLAIDIDSTVPQDLEGDDPHFDGDDIWCPKLANPEGIEKKIAAGLNPYLGAWYPRNLRKVFKMQGMDIMKEAYQHRSAGRAALFMNYESFISRAHNKLDVVWRSSLADFGASNDQIPMVYVICSLAGGTGSGMFLDVAAAMRTLPGVPNIEMSGIFYLPDMFIGRLLNANHDVVIPYANTYGALKELDYFQVLDPSHRFHVKYSAKHESSCGPRLFDMVYLIDQYREDENVSTGAMRGRGHVSEAVADFVVANITDVSWGGGGGLAKHIGNLHQVNNREVSSVYSSFGSATYQFPLEKIVTFAQARLYQLLSERLQSGSADAEMIRAMIDGDERSGMRAIWNSSGAGELMPVINIPTSFARMDPEDLRPIPKAKIAEKLRVLYLAEIDNLRRKYLAIKAVIDKWPNEEAKAVIDSKLNSIINNPEQGLVTAKAFLERLRDSIKAAEKDYVPVSDLSANFSKVFMKPEDRDSLILQYKTSFGAIGAIRGLLFPWAAVEPHVTNLIQKLGQDLNKGAGIIQKDLINAACHRVRSHVEEKLRQLDQLLNELANISISKMAEANQAMTEARPTAGNVIMVGVDSGVFERGGQIDEMLSKVIIHLESIVRAEIAKTLDIDITRCDSLVQTKVLETGLDRQNVLDKLGQGPELTLRLTQLLQESRAMWRFDPDALATAGGLQQAAKTMLSIFRDTDVQSRNNAKVPDNALWIYSKICDKNKMIALCLNAGKPFEYLSIARKCYERYLEKDGNVRGPAKWQTTVLPEAKDFPELVMEGISGMNPDDMCFIAEDLCVLERTKTGRCRVILQIEPKVVKSYDSQKKLVEALKREPVLMSQFRAAIVNKLVAMGTDGAKKWLAAHNARVPLPIMEEVCNKLNIRGIQF